MTGLSVLIVEDDAMIGQFLSELLEEMGHTVCAVVSREEDAVVAAARLRPDLLLVDMNLQEGSGVSAVDRIRNASPMPCVFMSGGPSRQGWPNGTVLLKPFTEQDLIRAI